jgi:hypothetical protein
VRLLLDACVPRTLKKELGTTHNIWTARERGWNGLADGLLLAAMEGQIDALITVDKGLRWQQGSTDALLRSCCCERKATSCESWFP